jgi:nucleoside-diphosphate-sugar epimerase
MVDRVRFPIAKYIDKRDRVLVLGASGWLGKSSLSLLLDYEVPLLAMASSEKKIGLSNLTVDVKANDLKEVEAFQPTVVIDCAFLTNNKLSEFGLETFVEINSGLIQFAKKVQSLQSVRKFVAVSSGAAKRFATSSVSDQSTDPYGALKLEYERIMLDSVDSPGNTVMLRPWNLSGPYCGDKTYALYDFIQQSKSGLIEISSEKRIYRRYTAAEDLIFLGIASEPSPYPLDSGGEIVELEQLAHRVFASLGLPGRVSVRPERMGEDRYYAENDDFEKLANSLDFAPSSLDEQILLSSQAPA